ncbi:MAG TPA: phosphodiester glycosidase family protein [Rhizomicrobium sp.]|nr:phosphodiester glycosidase family protein [Rhizomicrobium sp.]
MTFEGSAFTVCAFDARTQDMRLFWAGRDGAPLRSFAALGQGGRAARLRFAMNAGMYAPDFQPVGLYVENGAILHPVNTQNGDGNFALKPNGVFWAGAQGDVHVETTEAFVANHRRAIWATQSGPMLVINGTLHPKIAVDGPSRNIRNGVGVGDARTAYFVISDDAVSFGRMARFFQTQLHCANALYFDGTISSVWVPALNRQDHAYELGPMVAVFDRK